MRKLSYFLVLVLLALSFVPVRSSAQYPTACTATIGNNSQRSCYGQVNADQETILTTISVSGTSQTWPITTGMTNHSVTYTPSAGLTGITVTFAASSDGGANFVTQGTSSKAGDTITATGPFNVGKVTVTWTGTGFFDFTYAGLTPGRSVFNFSKTFIDPACLSWAAAGSPPDVFLCRDAANALAQRNGTNAQNLRIYETYTDSSNNDYTTFDYTTTPNIFTIGTTKNGSGTARAVRVGIIGGEMWDFTGSQIGTTNSGGSSHIIVGQTGYFGAAADQILSGDATGHGAVLKGTTTNNNAAAGAIGEYIQSQVTSGALVNLATGSATTITSITLTAGDWDVSGVVDYRLNAATSLTVLKQGSALATGVFGAQDSSSAFEQVAAVPLATVDMGWVIPTFRYSLSATTVIYLTSQANFTLNTAQAYGTIRARRVR